MPPAGEHAATVKAWREECELLNQRRCALLREIESMFRQWCGMGIAREQQPRIDMYRRRCRALFENPKEPSPKARRKVNPPTHLSCRLPTETVSLGGGLLRTPKDML